MRCRVQRARKNRNLSDQPLDAIGAVIHFPKILSIVCVTTLVLQISNLPLISSLIKVSASHLKIHSLPFVSLGTFTAFT